MSMSVDEVIENQITASVMIIDDQSASRKILKETIKNINPGISVKVSKRFLHSYTSRCSKFLNKTSLLYLIVLMIYLQIFF